MSREDKRQREDGSAAGKVFAFIGVTLVVLILAALAAVFIITKGILSTSFPIEPLNKKLRSHCLYENILEKPKVRSG